MLCGIDYALKKFRQKQAWVCAIAMLATACYVYQYFFSSIATYYEQANEYQTKHYLAHRES